jgi:hypothetical protein
MLPLQFYDAFFFGQAKHLALIGSSPHYPETGILLYA